MVFSTGSSRRAAVPPRRGRAVRRDPADALLPRGRVAGTGSVAAWREALGRARKIGSFTGTDARAFPRAFAVLARAHRDLSRVRTTYPMPLPMPVDQAADALAGRDGVTWEDM